ncbi:MAG: MEDS domain-containing protein [Actinomycetota bacterium]|nr:MEDS domain-containing protein [Actinomycetota bacterium]
MASEADVVNAGPRDHVVVFYEDDRELAGRVTAYLLDAVRDGTAIVVATAAHRLSFAERLERAGVDLAAARRAGSYLELDAGETMRGFLIGDWPDPGGFWQVISPLIQQAARRGGKPVRIFGEMVALLWDAGLPEAAVELEVLWNELGRQHSFSLLCAYLAESVSGEHRLDALTEVCAAHVAVAGLPSDPGAAAVRPGR